MWDSQRATDQGLSFLCAPRHPLSKHVPGLGCVSRTILGAVWGGQEVKAMVLASNTCSQHIIISRVIMADATYLMHQPFWRSIFDKGFLDSDQSRHLVLQTFLECFLSRHSARGWGRELSLQERQVTLNKSLQVCRLLRNK